MSDIVPRDDGAFDTVRPLYPLDVDVGSGQFVEEEGEDGGEARVPKKLRSPQPPAQEEIDEHCLTHLPFRNWCRHCVRAKGRAVDHKSQERDGLSEIHLDYCFLSSETGINLTCIVA